MMFGRTELGPDGAKALAEGEYLAGVEELFLSMNGIGDRGVEALAASETLRPTLLALTNNHLRGPGTSALLRSPVVSQATRLDLNLNTLGPQGLVALLESKQLLPATRRYVFDLCAKELGISDLKAGLRHLKVKGYSKLKRVDLEKLVSAQI